METNFIRQYKNVLSKRDCEKLINFFNSTINSGLVAISYGAQDNGGGENRMDEAIFLERVSSDIANSITQVIKTCWEKYVHEFSFLSNQAVISYASKMQKTPPMGGFHQWHWEHNSDFSNRNRMAVWTLYLTDHEDEGETEFLAHGLKVKPEAGKFCIFPADYTAVHRGNPVYSKDKYIVTGWYEYHDGGV